MTSPTVPMPQRQLTVAHATGVALAGGGPAGFAAALAARLVRDELRSRNAIVDWEDGA